MIESMIQEQCTSRKTKSLLIVWRFSVILLLLLVGQFLITGCSIFKDRPPVEQDGEANMHEEATQALPTQASPTTPAPTPTATPVPRVLTICLGAEPDTLYLYGGNTMAQRHVLEAIYDGPIDDRSFEHQAIILEKIPNLADGDAVLQAVTMSPGDEVVDVYGSVVKLDEGEWILPSGCSMPECAIEYDGVTEIQMDQLVVTFNLLPELRWSDGVSLTAQDSVYSFNLAADQQTPGLKNTIERTVSYEALDDTTIRWIGLPGFRDQSYHLNFWSPLPEHVWGEYSPGDLLEAEVSSRTPMGWGSYIIDEWVPGDQISLWRNPNYHRTGDGYPFFDKLVYRFVGQDGGANLAALGSGECDFLDQEASLTLLGPEINTTLELDANGEIKADFSTGTVWEHADFGIWPLIYDDGYIAGVERPDFFGDARTRQAIAMCMDRQALVDSVMNGLSEVVDTYLPPAHPLFNPEAASYGFDVEAASVLLNEVGWIDQDGLPETPRLSNGVWNVVDGTPLSFTLLTTMAVQRQQTAQILVDSLAQCGIQVELVTLPVEQFYAPGPEGMVFGRNFDLAHFAWFTDARPRCEMWITEQIPGDPNILDEEGNAVFPFGWGGLNATGYSNLEYDAICHSAMGALPGEPAYVQNHLQAQELFAGELPSIPLYMRLKLAVARADMCGFEMDPTASSELWNLEGFNYGDGCPE
jgi:peptide/nickel transport system substrate-binding protein